MFGTQHLLLFAMAVISLSAIPGPDMMYIVTRSVAQGRRAGVASVLGISTALFCHSMVVAFGLSAILATSQTVFEVIRYAGAAYLVYLGIQAWREAGFVAGAEAVASAARVTGWRLYSRGVITGLLNPKTTLFFLALLPQFVQLDARHNVMPFLFLGALVVIIGGMCDLTVAMLSGFLSSALRRSPRVNRLLGRATSLVYIGLGLNMLRLKEDA